MVSFTFNENKLHFFLVIPKEKEKCVCLDKNLMVRFLSASLPRANSYFRER